MMDVTVQDYVLIIARPVLLFNLQLPCTADGVSVLPSYSNISHLRSLNQLLKPKVIRYPERWLNLHVLEHSQYPQDYRQ